MDADSQAYSTLWMGLGPMVGAALTYLTMRRHKSVPSAFEQAIASTAPDAPVKLSTAAPAAQVQTPAVQPLGSPAATMLNMAAPSVPDHVGKTDFDYLCEALPHIVWVVFGEGTIGYFNQNAHDYAGVPKLDPAMWGTFLHPDDRLRVGTHWASCKQKGELYYIEHRLRRFDGVYRWHVSRALPIKNKDGKVYKWFGTCLDIHDQKMLAENLHGTDARLEAVTKNAALMLWAVDKEGILTYAAGKGLENLRFEGDKSLGRSVFTIFADNSETSEMFRLALSGQHATHEQRIRDLWFEAFFAPIRDAEGEIQGAVGLSIDITLRKKSEARYRDNQRLSAIIDAQQRITTGPQDADSIRTAILQAVLEVCQADQATIQLAEGDHLVVRASHGENGPAIGAAFAQNNSFSGRAFTQKSTLIATDVAKSPFVNAAMAAKFGLKAIVATPIKLHTDFVGVLTCESRRTDVFDDSTARALELFAGLFGTLHSQALSAAAKQQAIQSLQDTEKDLIRAREQAEQGARLKTEFLANMSHEIRTPLNGIIGLTDMLLESELNFEQHKYAKIVQESGMGLLTIINDILDFSKIEAGRFALESIAFDVHTVIDDQVALLVTRVAQRGLTLKTFVDPTLAPKLMGDPGRIGQVLLNLIGNAIKFTETGIICVRASIDTASATHQTIRVSVTDTGIGIAPEVQQTLFQPFIQADGSTARRFGGTGLGLSISKRLVELMGGTIGVDSLPSHGSTFWFALPLARAPQQMAAEHADASTQSAAAAAAAASEPRVLPRGHRTARILVADDNSVNLLLASAMLKSLGYSLQTVSNGQEAVTALAQSSFDLILMDCQMPEMDGYEATRAIRRSEAATGRHIPIVALTANALREDAQKCLASGMDDYLSKPIKKTILGETLSRWLAEHPSPQAASPLRALADAP